MMFEIVKLVVSSVFGGIVGGLIVAYTNDKLTRNRERDSGRAGRKLTFLAFMVQLKAETEQYHAPNTFATFYSNKVPNLRHAASLIRADFSHDRRTKFDELVAVASGYNGAQAQNGQKQILADFEKIISYVDT
jgi:hypothetical protein